MGTIKNPDFHIEPAALELDLARMANAPRPLTRPVVILGGWHSPGVANLGVASVLRPFTSGGAQDFLSVTYPTRMTLRSAAESAMAAIRARGLEGREVDLIGISMGGIIARALTAGMFGHAPVPAARVFTLATPHRGAKIARMICPDPCAWDMRPGATFLGKLNGAQSTAELVCYGILRDWWIGARNTAPPGMHPHWIDARPGVGRLCTHFAINHDPRVLGDLARRLRGETPIAVRPSEPPQD